jgi:tetratricopeptide (TPR) repeat protein
MRDVRISYIVGLGLACGALFLAMPVASQADDQRDCFSLGMESAIKACTKAIASGGAKGDDLAALYNARGAEYDTLAGFLQDTENNMARAIADYNEAIRLSPNYSSAYYNRGTWYLAKDDFDRAIADLNEAIRIGPQASVRGTDFSSRQGDEQKADFFHARGQAYFGKKDSDHAIEDYDEAIRLNPKLTRAFVNRGLAYRAKGDVDRANVDFDQAIKLDPEIDRP